MKREINVKLRQNWADVYGVSEKARQVVETYITEDGLTFSGGDRFGERTGDYITLDKESMIFLAELIKILTPLK